MVGSHLTAELLKAGYAPLLLIRDPQHTELLHRTLERMGVAERYEQLQFRTTMLNNPLDLHDALEGADTLFHCAAHVSFDPATADQTISENTEMTNHVVNAALECHVRLFVHISSIATLGAAHAGQPFITEESILSSLVGRSPYSISKFYAECAVRRGMTQGLQAIIVNPSVILGEGDWRQSSSQLVAMSCRNGLYYTPGIKGYVDVRDVARMTLQLAEQSSAVGKRFILNGANLSFKQFFTMMRHACGLWAPLIGLHRRTLIVLMHLERQLSRHFTHHRCLLSAELVANACDQSLYSADRVCRLLRTTFTPIEDTIHRVANAYQADRHASKKQNR